MLDPEVRPKMVGSNKNKFYSALAVELGLPVDILEQALEKVNKTLEQNEDQNGDNILDNSSPSSPTNVNVHNNIQESELDELSRNNHDFHPSLDNDLEIHKIQKESSSHSLKKNRKDSLSSLIEITQSGSTSINIKLPSLYASSKTVQGEVFQNSSVKSSDVNVNSVNGNLNRSESISYSDEQSIHNISNNKGLMQNRQNSSVSNISKEYVQPQVQNTYESFMPEVQNRQKDPVPDISKEYIQPQVQNQNNKSTYESFIPEVQNRQKDPVPDISQNQNTYESFIPEVQNRQNDLVPDISQNLNTYESFIPEVQNRQKDPVSDTSNEYIPPQVQNSYESFMPEAQNRQIDSVPDEFIQPQRRDSLSLDKVQDIYYDTYKSFTPESEVSNVSSQRQLIKDSYKSFSNSSHSYASQSQVYISQVVNQQPKTDLIKNKPSEIYYSEFPSLSEVSKKGDSRKNSEVDLGAWGQMDLNIASAWGKPKKWSSETETNAPEPPVNTWNPEDVNQLTWKPIQEPKAPMFFKKKKNAPPNFELDDNEGWGAPPTKYIPWDDSRQGYCVDLIEEQKGTVFWSVQNGTWVNVSEEVKITQEMKITQEKRIVECTSNGVNHRNIRQTRTQTQRTERQGIDKLDGATWSDIREQTRRERIENGLAKNETIMIELTDDENNSNSSSKTEDFQSNSAKCATTSEGPRERLGNPRWKTEEEWRAHKALSKQENLINFDMQEFDSKSSDDEPSTGSDRDENVNSFGLDDEISNWDEGSAERSMEAITDIETVKDDAWFTEDFMTDEQKRQEDNMIEENLLINVDSNSDNVATESTIINTHPPIFHGTISNEMSDSNDFLLDYTNPVNITNTGNNTDLLSFDDDEDKNSSDIISTDQVNTRQFDFDELEVFLESNGATPNTGIPVSSDSKFENVQPKIENQNELQSVIPYIINLNDNESSHYTAPINSSNVTFNQHCHEDSPRTNFEPTTPPSALNVNDSENKRPVDDPNSKRATENGREYFININIETPSNGRQILRLSYDDDPQEVTTEFCRKWGMFQYEDALKGLVQKELKKKLRKRKTKCKVSS